jgi:hypothetical protein
MEKLRYQSVQSLDKGHEHIFTSACSCTFVIVTVIDTFKIEAGHASEHLNIPKIDYRHFQKKAGYAFKHLNIPKIDYRHFQNGS